MTVTVCHSNAHPFLGTIIFARGRYHVHMAEEISEVLLAMSVLALVLLGIYLYIASISKALKSAGLTEGEASAIVFLTLFLGWITIPIFPYDGWWVGISIGGGLIPLVLCAYFVKTGRAAPAESVIGIAIVAYLTYSVTRAEEGVGIVADIPVAFAPALAAGLYSLSVFWQDIRRAAPLAYVSGIVGSLVGADVFHLGEVLAFEAPSEGFPMLSIGGGNIFDMVYLTGVVSIFIAMFVLWLRRQQMKHGFGAVVAEWERGAEGLPYAQDIPPAPTLYPSPSTRERKPPA